MTSRDMSAAMLAAIAANTVRPAIFYEGQYADAVPASTQQVLLHFDGADGATTTTDDYGNTVTLYGTATLSTTGEKFGTACLDLANSISDYCEVTGVSFGSAGWTMECQVNFPVYPDYSGAVPKIFFAINAAGYGVWLWPTYPVAGSIAITVALSSTGTGHDIVGGSGSGSFAINLNQNYHLAITRDQAAQKYYVYWEGVKIYELASALEICAIDHLRFGSSTDNPVNGKHFKQDEFRLSNTCRYPGGTTFVPPTAAFSGLVDQYVRLFTGLGTISWNGYTWTGGGDLLSISPIEEKVGIEAVGFSVRLSGVPSASIQRALNSMQQGLPGKLWLGLFDANNTLIADPYMLRRGKFDITVIERTGEICTIQVNYEDRLIDLERPRGRRYTTADQQRDSPTDLGFNMVQSIQDMQVLWR